MSISKQIKTAEALITLYQKELEKTPQYQLLQTSRKNLFELCSKQEEQEENEKKIKFEEIVKTIKEKGYELRTGHEVDSDISWRSGLDLEYIIILRSTPEITLVKQFRLGVMVYCNDSTSFSSNDVIFYYGSTEEEAWEMAVNS